ncbi:DUF2922 domain-containing protein [Peptostreptococcus faecalis]|uniref:DUF2922 domain-containing protein n=1 Tax=Peptostreptococcus faecalis TaxID=2045015 RepID=UPI000C7E4103|nr:DUF2922 domain-containing protein [Peptostreptococcus faecalis]
MENNKSIVMRFKKVDDKKFSLSVNEPKDDITEATIKDVMDFIVAKQVLEPKGIGVMEAVDAKLMNVSTEKYDLVL